MTQYNKVSLSDISNALFLEIFDLRYKSQALIKNVLIKISLNIKFFNTYLIQNINQNRIQYGEVECPDKYTENNFNFNIFLIKDDINISQGKSRKGSQQFYKNQYLRLESTFIKDFIRILSYFQLKKQITFYSLDINFLLDCLKYFHFFFAYLLNNTQSLESFTFFKNHLEIISDKIHHSFKNYQRKFYDQKRMVNIFLRQFVKSICHLTNKFFEQVCFLTKKVSIVDTEIQKIQKIEHVEICQIHFSKQWLSKIIQQEVKLEKNKKQVCLNCQNRISSCEFEFHISLCHKKMQIKQAINYIENQVKFSITNLNGLFIEIKTLKMKKNKQKIGKKIFTNHILSTQNKICLILDQQKHIQSIARKSTNDEIKDQQDVLIQNQKEKLQNMSTFEINYCLKLILKTFKFYEKTLKYNIELNILFHMREFKKQLEAINKCPQLIIKTLSLFIQKSQLKQKLSLIQKRILKTNLIRFHAQFQDIQLHSKFKLSNIQSNDKYELDQILNFHKTCQTKNVSLKDFKVIKLLAKGQYGEVYLVKKVNTNIKYAMKRIRLNFSHHQIQNLKNQTTVFKMINGDYLIKALFSFTQDHYHYFIMEYASNGDFADKLAQQQRFYEYQARSLLAQIAVGINNLHEVGVVHRDIKPQNVVIDQDGHLKIIDYGLSEIKTVTKKELKKKSSISMKFIDAKNKLEFFSIQRRVKMVGSPYYMAPQIINLQQNNHMIDWWSFGILTYQILVGQPPFVGENFKQIASKINEGNIWQDQKINFGNSTNMISFQAKSLIQQLLTPNPEKRLGQHFEDIKSHQFFQGVQWNRLRKNPSTLFVYQKQQQQSSEQTSLLFQTQQQFQQSESHPVQNLGLNFFRNDFLIKETKRIYCKHLVKLFRLNRSLTILGNEKFNTN